MEYLELQTDELFKNQEKQQQFVRWAGPYVKCTYPLSNPKQGFPPNHRAGLKRNMDKALHTLQNHNFSLHDFIKISRIFTS